MYKERVNKSTISKFGWLKDEGHGKWHGIVVREGHNYN
jgi:hypothetical protein